MFRVRAAFDTAAAQGSGEVRHPQSSPSPQGLQAGTVTAFRTFKDFFGLPPPFGDDFGKLFEQWLKHG
jgi:hypothetical protein